MYKSIKISKDAHELLEFHKAISGKKIGEIATDAILKYFEEFERHTLDIYTKEKDPKKG